MKTGIANRVKLKRRRPGGGDKAEEESSRNEASSFASREKKRKAEEVKSKAEEKRKLRTQKQTKQKETKNNNEKNKKISQKKMSDIRARLFGGPQSWRGFGHQLDWKRRMRAKVGPHKIVDWPWAYPCCLAERTDSGPRGSTLMSLKKKEKIKEKKNKGEKIKSQKYPPKCFVRELFTLLGNFSILGKSICSTFGVEKYL